jgi:MFS family permease
VPAPTTEGRLAAQDRGVASLRVLLTSFSFANLADGLTLVVFPLLAISASHSALDVGLVAAFRTAPWAVVAPLVGVFVDRLPLRRLLVSASVLRTVTLSIVATVCALGQLSIPFLVLVSFVVGIGEALYDVTAQTALPAVVGPDQLESANSKQTVISEVLHGFLGPAFGGLISIFGLQWGLLTGAVNYGLAALLAFRLGPLAAPSTTAPRGILTDMVVGFRSLWRNPLMRIFLIATGCLALSFAGWSSMFSLFAVAPGPLGLNSFQYGMVFSISASGGVTAALLVPRLARRLRRSHLLAFSVVAGAACLVAPTVVSSAVISAAALSLYGACVITWNIITVSYRQRCLPQEELGRVNATYRGFAWGLLPIGPVAAGIVGDITHSARGGMIAMAAVSMIAVFAVPMIYRYRSTLDGSGSGGGTNERP